MPKRRSKRKSKSASENEGSGADWDIPGKQELRKVVSKILQPEGVEGAQTQTQAQAQQKDGGGESSDAGSNGVMPLEMEPETETTPGGSSVSIEGFSDEKSLLLYLILRSGTKEVLKKLKKERKKLGLTHEAVSHLKQTLSSQCENILSQLCERLLRLEEYAETDELI